MLDPMPGAMPTHTNQTRMQETGCQEHVVDPGPEHQENGDGVEVAK